MRFSHALGLTALAVAPSLVLARPATTALPSTPSRVECYRSAADAGLEDRKAIALCRGAMTAAPGRCADAAIDQLGFSDRQAIRLCRGANSMAPVTCARRVEGLGLADRGVIGYCAALPWPVIAAWAAGSPQCIESALDRTLLAEREAMRLCRGSDSTAPVECFERGDDATLLSDQELLDLCAPAMVSAPVAILP